MRNLFLLLGLLAALAIPAFPQTQTVVTGTVTDPNGIPYANGTMKATIQPVPPGSPCVVINGNCQPIQGTVGPVPLNASGTFSTNLWANSLIQPSGSQWSIQICISPGVSPPLGTGPQCFSVTTTISGSSQDLSTALDAAAPSLANLPSGGAVNFASINSGTNNHAAMQVSSGATLAPAGSGEITANLLSGAAFSDAQPQFALYTFSNVSGTVSARNNATGTVDYFGTDAGNVIDNALNAVVSQGYCGGTFYFKNPTGTWSPYNLNSLILANDAVTNYAIGIPAGTASCQWIFEAESRPVWVGETSAPIQNTGVVFYVTPTAVSSVGATALIAAEFTETGSGYFESVRFKNIAIRFPSNQRGNEIAFDNYNAITVDYSNTLADFNEQYSSIIPAVPGANGLIGYTSGNNGAGNAMVFSETYATGYDNCYDWESEHTIVRTATGIYCNNLGYYGRRAAATGGPVHHPSEFTNLIDQENVNGLTLGSNIAQGTLLDIHGYDLEFAASGTWARNANFYETNCGYTSGHITYTAVEQNVGNENIPNLWSNCGQNFRMLNSADDLAFPDPTLQDAFNRPNANSLGPQWSPVTGIGDVVGIIGAKAALPSGAVGASFYDGRVFNPDQFSRATVGAINSSGSINVAVRMSATAETFYEYVCGFSIREIFKFVAGTPTTLASNSGTCSAGDSVELDVAGSQLTGIYIPNGGSPSVDLTATDTSITSGQPGLILTSDGIPGDTSATYWTGGSLPTKTGPDSVFNQPNVWNYSQSFLGGMNAKVYTVSSLPTATSVLPGTQFVVSDALTFTPGTCTGGGSDTMIAVSNGTAWSCH